MSCSGKLPLLSLDTFYSVGSVCTTTHVLKLALSWYLMGRVTVRFGHFLFSLFLELRVAVFVSHVNIYEQPLFSNAYIKNESLDVLAKQNRKRKNKLKFHMKINCIDFLQLACNRNFCTKRLTS